MRFPGPARQRDSPRFRKRRGPEGVTIVNMDKALSGKTAVVTGGTRGIGRAIAETLAREGVNVAICGRSSKGVQSALEEMRAALPKEAGSITGTAADVSRWEDVQQLFSFAEKELGGLDILVNNAGVGVFSSIGSMSPEDWHRVIDLNLSGVFYCCRTALPLFQKRGGGYVINISSLAGKNPFAGGAAYNASKFGLNGFSEAMMLDHRYDNVRVSYVMPGSVDTGFSPRSGPGEWKIASQDVADIVLMLVRMPERTLVSRVEVRPSKPPQK
jgi:3-oxoacyl-[acyl-carrier protein] reductase